MERRRDKPMDDLASVIANARIDADPIIFSKRSATTSSSRPLVRYDVIVDLRRALGVIENIDEFED